VLALPFVSIGLSTEETHIMDINTRRSFFGRIAAMAALVTGAPRLFSQQTSPAVPPPASGATIPGTMDDVRVKVLDAVLAACGLAR